MIDLHCHLLYDTDDGPSKIEDSIRMISEAQRIGIKQVVSTVHIHNNLFHADKTREKYQKLKNRAGDFGIELLLGYEVYLDSILPEDVRRIMPYTLNSSRYMLIEFPYSEFPEHGFEVCYEFYKSNIIPVIAHPERCRLFTENKNVLLNFIEGGCMVQIDAASIIGVYGRHAKNFAKDLIKTKKAHFVASNAHFADDYTDWYMKAYHKVIRWADKEYANALFKANAELIVGNSPVDFSEAINNGRCVYGTSKAENRTIS